MTISRILVTHSVQDGTVDVRMDVLKNLGEYELLNFFILEESANDAKKLAIGLTEAIESFNPDMVLVHLGLSYYVMGEAYLNEIERLQKRFPAVLFVADRDLQVEHQGKYAIRGAWDDTSAESFRICMAASFGIVVDGGSEG